jgi:hypothetical protein
VEGPWVAGGAVRPEAETKSERVRCASGRETCTSRRLPVSIVEHHELSR